MNGFNTCTYGDCATCYKNVSSCKSQAYDFDSLFNAITIIVDRNNEQDYDYMNNILSQKDPTFTLWEKSKAFLGLHYPQLYQDANFSTCYYFGFFLQRKDEDIYNLKYGNGLKLSLSQEDMLKRITENSLCSPYVCYEKREEHHKTSSPSTVKCKYFPEPNKRGCNIKQYKFYLQDLVTINYNDIRGIIYPDFKVYPDSHVPASKTKFDTLIMTLKSFANKNNICLTPYEVRGGKRIADEFKFASCQASHKI